MYHHISKTRGNLSSRCIACILALLILFQNMAVYAEESWKEIVSDPVGFSSYHKVTFEAEGETASIFVSDGSRIESFPEVTVPEGKRLLGWYTGDTAVSEDTAVTSDLHIRAVFTTVDSALEAKKAGAMYVYENTGAYTAVSVFGDHMKNQVPSAKVNTKVLGGTVLEAWTVDGIRNNTDLTLEAVIISLPAEGILSAYTVIDDQIVRKVADDLEIGDRVSFDLSMKGAKGIALVLEKEKDELLSDDTVLWANDEVFLTGKLPSNGVVTAEPVAIEIEGEEVISAYSIQIYANENQRQKGNPWNPVDKKVEVHFYNEAFSDNMHVYYVDNGQIERIDTVDAVDGWVKFKADSFFVYAITRTIETVVLASDGNNYRISVTYTTDSGIPADAELAVTEILGTSEIYEGYASKTRNVLGMESDTSDYIRLFDISIVDKDGKKIAPPAGKTFDVRIELMNSKSEEVSVVHFADENDSGSVVNAEVDGQNVSFETDGFSVYALVYTVDFAYSVNGKTYQFSLPGGGFVSFADLVEVLGILGDASSDETGGESGAGTDAAEAPDGMLAVTASDAARKFTADVVSLEFSSPELVDVSKAENGTTVGQIKESRGLECEYSAELTEEQIAEINGTVVEPGDWALISLRPFQSEETMTVTMKDGEIFTVKVTDAQIKKTVIDAKGDTWEITVTYGPEAGIPDGTELKVVEYSEDDLLFNECFSEREKWIATVTHNIDNDSQEDQEAEDTESLSFEPGFGDTVNYPIAGGLSDEDKTQAMSVIPLSGMPIISGYILFDISLIYNEAEIEPLAPVQVTIQSANPDLQEYDNISVGHFVEDATDTSHELSMETIDEISCSSEDGKENALITVDFKTSSFSLYDVTGIQWTANQSKTVYFALKTGINKVLTIDQNGAIPVFYSQIENMDPSAVSAYIRSLPDYANVEPIIIYDKSGDDFYAIDGNGNLAQVYESGDTVMWTGQPSIGWKLVRYMNDDGVYTGYYDFINMETGKFLTPQANQTVNSNRIGVQLDGAADYSTTIKAWDNAVNAYCGYSIQNNQLVTNESINWFFASVSQTVSDDLKLQTVETVDSRSLGITIKMFNYPNTSNKNNRAQYQSNFQIFDSSGRDWLSDGSVIQGLVKNTLNSNGFPVTTYGNKNLNGLFTGGNGVTETNANHLFIKQTYDETGYFEYSSFENYAYLGSGTNFTVYRQIGVEDKSGKKTYGNSTEYYFNRGNFLPYNSIKDYKTATQNYQSSGVTNKYDENGNLLSDQDPRSGEALFLTQEDVDYFFGMSMEANFYQPVNGKNNGTDVIYEFNGDDDLWIFIDNVLVLDIGGCHHAHSGTINFSTGAVRVETGNGTATTTIKECFRNAGIFPDGTAWDNSRVNQYFKGDTFADYSQHNMKMFYMERGAGASNLHMKFNLPVIKDAGKLIVDKVVSGTVNEKYSNDKYAFQVIRVNGNIETRFVSAVYESNGQPVEYKHEAVFNGTTYNDVFYLRPGEAAVFDVPDNSQQYYVRELGIDTQYYDRVLINGEVSNISGGIAKSSTSSVKNRNRVTYDNHGVTENLRIRKTVEGDVKRDSDKFEFYVYLTGPNNELIPYSNGDYYVLDPDGNYCTYVNGLPVGDSTITENTRTAYHSGQWGTIGSIPDGYTVLIPDLLVGTDFMVSERMDNIPSDYELKSIGVDAGTAETATITGYANVTTTEAGAITIGSYSYSNHCEGKLKKDAGSDATVTVTNQSAKKLTIEKRWLKNDYVTEHGPVQFALYKLDNGNEVLVENSVKTLTAPDLSIEYRVIGNIADYVVREVVVATDSNGTTVTPVNDNGVIEVPGETTKLGSDMKDSYIVTYQQGVVTETSRTDTVTNTIPKLTVNKKDITNDNHLAGAEFKLTGDDGETALTGYDKIISDTKTSGNLLNGICLSNGTYYLVETKAPDGYNMLPYKVKIVVSGETSNIFTAFTDPESATPISVQTQDNNVMYTFNVDNTPGVELPATGGPGTRLFTILGSILLIGAAVLMWRKRRLN